MAHPDIFYQERVAKFDSEAKALHKKLTFLSTLRLLVFLVALLGLYLTFGNWTFMTLTGIAGIFVFTFVLSLYTDTKSDKQLKLALRDINRTELEVASGNYHHLNSGNQYQNPAHVYSLDIDLFGKGSFFQFINRTVIEEGAEQLAKNLLSNEINNVEKRQEAVKELASKPEWRQLYAATAQQTHIETPASTIIDWLKHHQTTLPKAMGWLPYAFGATSTLVFALCIFGFIPLSVLAYWLLLGLGITVPYLKKINVLAANTNKIKETFRQYAKLLDLIENETFVSELLAEKQKTIQSENQKAAAIFKKFSKLLDTLDNRNNVFSAIFGNGFLLTDLKQAHHIEKWIETYGHKINDWFQTVSFFDAYNSLGNYSFNHPNNVFPEIAMGNRAIQAKNLGHPLLPKSKRVDNDLDIDIEQFFIITGANMAGKSTFLRTVSLHIVMANVGLPVCATSSRYTPVKLITSMRTSDSLTDDSSYFFSELTRLKMIVDAIQETPYFIILDEILKGTNSTDKAVGSRKFVERLVASNATGIIATHDLTLCEIENNFDEVKNYHFDAEITNGELHFDYRLKQGVCKNMNASFLLKKMGIV